MSFTTLVSLLGIAACIKASPLKRRDMSTVIKNCNLDFAYTLDDGPYIYHDEICGYFEAEDALTTFFVNGNNWSCIYDEDNVASLRSSASPITPRFEKGHQIGHHTWSHASLTSITRAQIDDEIQRLDEAFVKILGVKPLFFRPPYGDINDDIATYIQTTYNKTIVMWSDDSGDSTGGNAQQSYDFYANFAQQGPGNPHLTLSHETEPAGIGALRNGTVKLLANAGIKLVTVAECIGQSDMYEHIGPYGTRDPSWQC